MTTYEFKGPDGDVVERHFDMGAAPEAITVNLVTYERIVSGGRRPIIRSLGQRTAERPIVGYSLPWKGDDEMTPEMEAAVPRWTPEGVPVFASAGEAQQFCDASKRAQESGKTERAFVYGSGPSATEYAEEHQIKKPGGA